MPRHLFKRLGLPNQITAHNAGWPSQFRFAGNVFWSGVCEFHRSP